MHKFNMLKYGGGGGSNSTASACCTKDGAACF